MPAPRNEDAPAAAAADGDPVAASAILTLSPAAPAAAAVIEFPATGRQGGDPWPSGGAAAEPAVTVAIAGTLKSRRRHRAVTAD